MKVALLVNEFPCLSETFVLSQIVGLIENDHSVDIYARNAQKTKKNHPLVEKHKLYEHVFYHPHVPANYLIRILKGISLAAFLLRTEPKVLFRLFNFKKYSRHTVSLKLLYRTIPFVKNGCPDYDIVLCHFGPIGLIALDLKELGVIAGKLCVVFHGLDLSEFLKESGETVYDQLFAKGDLMMPISKHWQKRLTGLGCEPSKAQVHHMGVDTQQFMFQTRSRQPNEPVCIITIARLVEKKGVEYGIRAIAQVKQHHPDIKYLIIGDGPLSAYLSNLIDELDLSKTVKLLGWQKQSEVIEVLKQAHILIAPSVTSQTGDMEGIPVVLMEAMAMGLPVVSTYHSGIPELVNDGVTGFLVQERDENALANRISYLIDNANQWPRLGQQGRAQVEAEFENAKLNQRLIAIFSALATGQDINEVMPENSLSTY